MDTSERCLVLVGLVFVAGSDSVLLVPHTTHRGANDMPVTSDHPVPTGGCGVPRRGRDTSTNSRCGCQLQYEVCDLPRCLRVGALDPEHEIFAACRLAQARALRPQALTLLASSQSLDYTTVIRPPGCSVWFRTHTCASSQPAADPEAAGIWLAAGRHRRFTYVGREGSSGLRRHGPGET